MALTNFVPEIWARELNYSLKKSLVGISLVNQDYEGEIRQQGDTVHITRPSAINTGSYTADNDITVQTPESTQLDLAIDQADYFAFQVDDVRKVQANVDLMRPYLEEANYALSDGVDEYILSLYTGADASNVIAASSVSSSTIYGKLVEAKKLLSVNNVPKSGRWITLSPEEIALLEESTQFISASALGDEVKRNGFVGRAAGFDVYESNNLTEAASGSDTVRHCPFGHNIAITFAMQFSNVESQRMEKRFADLVKGLILYGAKVIKPKALGDLRVIV